MKSINARHVACALSVLLLLTACSSTKEPQVRDEINNNEDRKITKDHTYAETINIDSLLNQPNHYHDGKRIISAEVRRRFSLALEVKQNGKLDEAESAFVELTVHEPALSGPWVQLGDIAKQRVQLSKKQEHKEQLLEKAAEQYRQAIFINSSNYRAHNRLAAVYRELGQFDMALTHYQKAINSWPAFAPAYKNRGILYDLYLGNKPQALVNYQTFQALNNVKASSDSQVAQDKQFIKLQRQIKGWIADLSRQIKQDASERASQNVEVANNAL